MSYAIWDTRRDTPVPQGSPSRLIRRSSKIRVSVEKPRGVSTLSQVLELIRTEVGPCDGKSERARKGIRSCLRLSRAGP
jgi:hypothetical protein